MNESTTPLRSARSYCLSSYFFLSLPLILIHSRSARSLVRERCSSVRLKFPLTDCDMCRANGTIPQRTLQCIFMRCSASACQHTIESSRLVGLSLIHITHTHTYTRSFAPLFHPSHSQLLLLLLLLYKYTLTPSEKSNRATQIGLYVWGVSPFPTRRECKRKQLCYWNGRMQMVMVGFSVENLYGDDNFQWSFFLLYLSLLCLTFVVISFVPGA